MQRGMIPLVLQDLHLFILQYILVHESSITNSTFNTQGKPLYLLMENHHTSVWTELKSIFHLASQCRNSIFLCKSICFLTSLRK